ncbi:MAG TPA: acetate/propionate family kinase [Geminicoccaceae bacterium]|nr:acetate/propionate family kinase [Geminicoccaceae bacterium]
MAETLLVINAGSSSIKFQLFEVAPDDLRFVLGGQIEGIGTRAHLEVEGTAGERLADRVLTGEEAPDVAAAMAVLGAWLRDRLADAPPLAVGHRVVHGGPLHAAPVRIEETVLQRLEALVPLAPLHQPNNLVAIRAIARILPRVVQVACFDTAFHRGHPEVADRFAISDDLYREGVRRYGFHGLSYEYIADRLRALDPALAEGRVVACHLGNGASMCAIRGGRSIDSTMGFSTVDGLPMGTRTGQLDPGVLLWLMTAKGYDAAALERFLYRDGGLKGLSGISSDVRDLLASGEPGAERALDYFVYRVVREAGALAAAMGGIDGIVFTAGIGEHSPEVRARVAAGLGWLGLELDAAANRGHGPRISTPGSRLAAWVIPTDEELMIARHTLRLVGRS